MISLDLKFDSVCEFDFYKVILKDVLNAMRKLFNLVFNMVENH